MTATTASTALRFRPDIEGLRALAILIVVACHAGWLPGGYVGVDVFFVISGYLITSHLQREYAQSQTIALGAFYARRIRRLLPAFLVMLVVVSLLGWVLFSPLEQPSVWRSVMAASLYISNFRFAADATNYWGSDAKADPLLHTWSLGVEEQFYLVWPICFLLVAAIWRRGLRHAAVLVVAGLFLLSFLLSALWVHYRQPDAFFWPLTRAWEFGAGAAIALPGERWAPSARIGKVMSWLGLGLIALAAVFFDGQSIFPGGLALLPVLGAVCLIAAVAPHHDGQSGSLAVWQLASIQALGRWSYAWYLWHWPLLVFVRMLWPGSLLAIVMALVVSLLLAAASSRWVEDPVRRLPVFRPGWVALIMLLIGPVVFVSVGVRQEARMTQLMQAPELQSVYRATGEVPWIYRRDCDRWFSDGVVVLCPLGMEKPRHTWMLVGDSHAGQWTSALTEIVRSRGDELVVATKSACPMVDEPFFYAKIGRIYRECDVWRAGVVQTIAVKKPDVLVMAGSENYPFSDRQWREGTERVVAALSQSAGKVVILRDTPLPGLSPPKCLARRLWQPAIYTEECAFQLGKIPSEALRKLHEALAVRYPNVVFVDMTPSICPDGRMCPIVRDGHVTYRDANHLADGFVRRLTPDLERLLVETGGLPSSE